VPETLGKGQFALGKETLGKGFAERQGSVRQRKAAVTTVSHRDAFFAERLQSGARQRANQFFLKISLPSASKLALGKEQTNIFFEFFFAELKGPNMARGGVNSLFKNSTKLTRASG